MNKEEFVINTKDLGINLTEKELIQLENFYKLMIEWNKKINLTTIVEEEEVYLKHFYDSLTLYKVINLNKDIELCDVGTGAGFPGIVLKICFPNLKITLIDTLQKRINYLNEIIRELNLSEIEAIHGRMEDFSRTNVEKFDCIVARAVANTSILAEISVRSLKIGRDLILMKGLCDEEIKESTNAVEKLNCSIERIEKFKLPKEDSNRTLIVIKKEKATPSEYPRIFDKIKKKPL